MKMKCVDCGTAITWGNSFGWNTDSCVCYDCLAKRAGGTKDPNKLNKALAELILWGIEKEKEKERN